MFGKKPKPIEVTDTQLGVPVFTVHTIPFEYEPLELIHLQIARFSRDAHDQAILEMSQRAAEVGADAVIGLMFHVAVVGTTHILHAFGTAIRYVTDEVDNAGVVTEQHEFPQ
jgi:hypothetical protein